MLRENGISGLGGSDYPVEELRVAGINLDDPETVKSALKVFDETIDELAEKSNKFNIV